jgi:[ribosomal protein S18]-alanine N-acetyltransferase
VRLFCAFEHEALVSFVLVSFISPQCEILTFATAQSARRKGVGRALFAHMFEAMRECGAEEVFLEVATDNDAARGLYESLGFTQVGLRKSYYARRVGYPVDALVLSCDL